MADDTKQFFIIFFLVLLAGGIFYLYSNGYFSSGSILPSVFTPNAHYMTQYVGSIPQSGGYSWIATHPYSVAQSSTAKIMDYQVITETFANGNVQSFVSCKPNDCNGVYKRTDGYGCSIWYGSAGSITCGADHAYQCSCRTEPEIKQCGDRQVECRRSPCGCPTTSQTFYCSAECGGANLQTLQSGRGCYSKDKVYYKGSLIYETPLLYSVSRKSFKEGVVMAGNTNSDLDIDFMKDYVYSGSEGIDTINGHIGQYTCPLVTNDYLVSLPPNAFTFDVDIPKTQVIKGEKIRANITVINNWVDTTGRLDILINIPYIVFGEQKQTSDSQSQFVSIKKGKNSFYFDLPTEQVTNEIIVTPTFYMLIPGNQFSGVNFYCFEQGNTKERDLSGCQYVSFGTLKGSAFNLQVNPAPIYLEKRIDCNTQACPPDYSCQSDSGLCIRTDIINNELTCMQLGCPTDYSCSSAGLCVQTVYVQKDCKIDSDCPSETKCDAGSGLCIETHIFDKILQCSSSSDCPNPCTGKSASCVLNKCTYSGECVKETINCNQLGCPTDYSCNSNAGVCVKTVSINNTVYVDNTIPTGGFSLSSIPLWAWIGALIFIFIIIFMSSKK